MGATPTTCETQRLTGNVLSSHDWTTVSETFKLSGRELAVAQLLFRGHSRDQMAFHLRKADGTPLSPETVRVYVDRLFRKMEVDCPVTMVLLIFCSLDWFRNALHEHNESYHTT